MRATGSAFQAGAATDVGKVRRRNEDNYLVATERGVWAVADGMGGHEAGDVASRLVIEELQRIAAPTSAADLVASCEARLAGANDRLKEIAWERGGVLIGTTVAVLLAYDDVYACVWAGDSRIYRIRDGAILQLTVDHTEVQELVAAGRLTAAQARISPRRNVVTRAIGVYEHPELETVSAALKPGDIFVICSDGLTAHVEDAEILAVAARNTPQRACDLLVARTLDRGASDNVTVVSVRFDPAALHPRGGVA